MIHNFSACIHLPTDYYNKISPIFRPCSGFCNNNVYNIAFGRYTIDFNRNIRQVPEKHIQ